MPRPGWPTCESTQNQRGWPQSRTSARDPGEIPSTKRHARGLIPARSPPHA